MRGVRLGGIALALVTACTGSSGDRPAQLHAAPQTVAEKRAPSIVEPKDPSLPEASLTALEEQGTLLAAGMRKVEGAEVSGSRELVRDVLARAEKDTCVRVIWSANEPQTTAKILDDAGRVLADAPAAKDGKLGARGPVCVRKGETMRLSWSAPGDVVVRYVAWAAP